MPEYVYDLRHLIRFFSPMTYKFLQQQCSDKMNIDFGLSNFNAKSNLEELTVLYRKGRINLRMMV